MQHVRVDTKGVIGGFDCHSDVHVGAALDPLGRLLGTASFPATPDGYRRATEWLHSLGPIIAVGVESTGSFGAALARVLPEQGLRTFESNQPHRHTRFRRGKTDAIDAEAGNGETLWPRALCSMCPQMSVGSVNAREL